MMKTVIINGAPYRMRGDMKLTNWRREIASRDSFRQGHLDYLTTPAACEAKRAKEGDDTSTVDGIHYFAGTPDTSKQIELPRFKTISLYGAPCLVRGDFHLPNYMKRASAAPKATMPPPFYLTKAVIATMPGG